MNKYSDGKEVKVGDRVIADVNGTGEPAVVQQLLSTGHVTVAYLWANPGSGVVEIHKADVHPNACMRIESIKLEVKEAPKPKAVEEHQRPPVRHPDEGEFVLFNPDGHAWIEARVTKVWSATMVNLQHGDEPEATSIQQGEGLRNWRFKA